MASWMPKRAGWEVFKFSVYLAVPVVSVYYLGSSNYPVLERVINNRSYVVYPPEGPRPPSNAELHKRLERENSGGEVSE